MGEINLIPGQQVRGQKKSGQKATEGMEYSQPGRVKIPAPSLIPTPAKPRKESWWQKRKAKQAARQTLREAERARAVVATARPVRPEPVDVNLLPHTPAQPTVKPKPIPPAPVRLAPARASAEPDFLSDAGFKSNSLPPSEAYSIRKPKQRTSSQPTQNREHAAGKHSARHEPVGESAELLDVNLIPRELTHKERPKHASTELIWYALTAGVIVGGMYGALQWYEFNLTQQSSELRQQIALLDAQIADYTAERETASELQTQLLGLNTLMTQHVAYDHFFSFLEQNTLPSVYFKTLNVDSRTGQVTASAVTANFDQIRAQEAVMQANPLVKDIAITSATRTIPTTPTSEEETIVVDAGQYPLLFNLSLSLDTSLFHP